MLQCSTVAWISKRRRPTKAPSVNKSSPQGPKFMISSWRSSPIHDGAAIMKNVQKFGRLTLPTRYKSTKIKGGRLPIVSTYIWINRWRLAYRCKKNWNSQLKIIILSVQECKAGEKVPFGTLHSLWKSNANTLQSLWKSNSKLLSSSVILASRRLSEQLNLMYVQSISMGMGIQLPGYYFQGY